MAERTSAAATVEQVLRRAEARLLACPYCQEPLHARQLREDTLQLTCPLCGFTEEPDVLPRAEPPLERPTVKPGQEELKITG